jgi:exosortase
MLQKASCQITHGLLEIAGTPVLREGFVLVLPGASIEVASQCSGINSTLGLLLGGILAAHLFLRPGWRQLLFALSIIPVSILKNALRIVTLYWLGVHTNQAFLAGKLHRYGGILFSLLALVMLVPLFCALREAPSHRSPGLAETATPSRRPGGSEC